MEIYQLKTFVAVAREGSITRAAEQLHLSQPAVSAHIKAIEDTLGLALFERTSRGMSLTRAGERIHARAEQTLAAHAALMAEATRLKGNLSGTLRLGAGSNSDREAAGRLLRSLAEQYPALNVTVSQGGSRELLAGLRSGSLDAAFYNEPGQPDPALTTIEVSRFKICLVAPPILVQVSDPPDWASLAELTWIYPTASTCCGQAAENLFRAHGIRPRRILNVDREDVTRTLVAGGTGIGLLHAETAREAQAHGEVELLFEAPEQVRVLFAHLAERAQDPLLLALRGLVGNLA